jgi:isopenicillin N synthase-like dioxygenase
VDNFRLAKTTWPPYELRLCENLWPATPADFCDVAEKYIEELVFLATEVVGALSLAFVVDENIFTNRIKNHFWNLRVLGYPPHL